MAISDIHYRTGSLLRATTNGVGVINKITKELQRVVSIVDPLCEMVARIIVERAQEKLIASGYQNTGAYADNIVAYRTKGGYWRVGIKENSDKPLMYLLEFGTGLVGDGTIPDPQGRMSKYQPHPLADDVGWEYAIGEHIRYSQNPEGADGWYYFDSDQLRFRFTSGLRGIAYLYDTIQEIPEIITEARRRLDNGK